MSAHTPIKFRWRTTVKGWLTVRWYRLTGRCPCGEKADQYGWCNECIQYGGDI